MQINKDRDTAPTYLRTGFKPSWLVVHNGYTEVARTAVPCRVEIHILVLVSRNPTWGVAI